MTRKYVEAKKILDEVQKLRGEGKTKRKIAEKFFVQSSLHNNRLKKISY